MYKSISIYGDRYLIFNIISDCIVCSLYNTIHVYNFASVHKPFICVALKNAISLFMCTQLLANCSV